MKKLWFVLAMLVCIFASCSEGENESPVTPEQKPGTSSSEITIDPTILSGGVMFETVQGEKSITFSTSSDWSLSIAETRSGTAWCTASPTSGGKGTANVKFTTSENTEPEDRSVAVTIKAGTTSKTFTITQKGRDALLVTTKKYELSKEGGEIEIEVKANVDYQMEISESAKEWITEVSGRALTSHKHVLNIAASEEAVKREGEITFKSGDMVETVKVYQAGEPAILLSKNELTVSDAGETISVDLQSNVEYGVQMPNVDWIQAEASRAMSSHTLKYIVKANDTYDSRETEIIFYDKNSELKNTLKVTQLQKDAIVLSKKEFNVKAEGETIEVELSSNVDFDFSIENDWVKQVEASDSRGLVSHKLYFEVAKNESEEERKTKIIFTDTEEQTTEAVIIKQEMLLKDIPYLTFTADAKQTLTMTKAVETLEYSVGESEEWKVLGTNKIEFGGELGNLRLRGKSNIGTNGSTFIIGNDIPIYCSGDIRTLLDFKKYDTVDTNNAKFQYLFYGCTALKQAPELPLTDLSKACYFRMFEMCTNLTSIPKLPATTLTESCYARMFEGCSSLVTVYKLPATKLAKLCYASMFKGCKDLTTPPELPAIVLADNCYVNMFDGCSSLKAAPELPATQLAVSCYNNMFVDCKNLTTTPSLNATELADSCYFGMFSGCTVLLTAPKLPAKVLADYCYAGMFSRCSNLVKAPELPATKLSVFCYNAMFSRCSSLTIAPDLPATQLSPACYMNMFNECSKLIKAPDLPAMILFEYCYQRMFSGCISLTTTPKLPATKLANKCYTRMFEKCTSLTSASELPAIIMDVSCYQGMFSECVNLTKAPKLPATTLGYTCYQGMFERCINLAEAPNLPATSLEYGCYSSMFWGCTSLVTPPELPAITLAEHCYQSMFLNCTSLIKAPDLLATILTDSCYKCMFFGCSQINSITMLATNISATDCLNGWVEGVSKRGLFSKAATMELLPIGFDGIPEGWEVKNYTEE